MKHKGMRLGIAMAGAVSLLAMADATAFDADEDSDWGLDLDLGFGKPEVRVAVLHGMYGNTKNAHHDEFDFALARLGWSSEKFVSTTESMDRLAAGLGRYDMALVCPLFNFQQGDARVDMTRYGKNFRQYVEDGGAVIVTDALYPEIVGWLTSIDPFLTLGSEPCNAWQAPKNTRPVNHLRFLPNRVCENNTWAHLALPEDHGWEVVATCSEGHPQAVMKRIGKGFVYVTGFRLDAPEFFENFLAHLGLQRAGLGNVFTFRLPQFNIGTNIVKMSVAWGKSIMGSQTIVPLAEEGYRWGQVWRKPRLAKPFPGEEPMLVHPASTGLFGWGRPMDYHSGIIDIEIPFNIEIRGDVRVGLELAKAIVFDKVVTIKPLLSIAGPRYRGFAVTSDLKKRKGQILAPVELNPHNEKLEDLTLKIKVTDAKGKTVGKAEAKRIAETRFLQPVNIGTPKPGAYTIVGELYEKGKLAETKTAPLTVLSDAECPVYINDDMNLVADSAAFFPVGIYHVNPDDLAQVAALGFNTVQMWSWFNDKAFTEPARHGLKVLYEQNHRGGGDEWVGKAAKGFAEKYPNLLMWYAMDEPRASDFDRALKLNDVYRTWDAGHPTIMVSCLPPLFGSQVALGDIFGVDPYPYPRWPLTMVSDWMDAAWEATRGDRPVFCAPQSFGTETPEALRAMSYLAVAHEARGLFWYPWDDGGTSGLKYHPALHGAMKQVVSEIKALSPALLNKGGRRQIAFKSAYGTIHGLYCQETPRKRYLILVNPETEAQTILLDDLDALNGVKALKEAFGDATLDLQTTRELTLGQYEVRVYVW